jgi:hypothetical protein
MSTPGMVTTAFIKAGEFGSALLTFRKIFDDMETEGIKFPSV